MNLNQAGQAEKDFCVKNCTVLAEGTSHIGTSFQKGINGVQILSINLKLSKLLALRKRANDPPRDNDLSCRTLSK